jgi:hypothetical protein
MLGQVGILISNGARDFQDLIRAIRQRETAIDHDGLPQTKLRLMYSLAAILKPFATPSHPLGRSDLAAINSVSLMPCFSRSAMSLYFSKDDAL